MKMQNIVKSRRSKGKENTSKKMNRVSLGCEGKYTGIWFLAWLTVQPSDGSPPWLRNISKLLTDYSASQPEHRALQSHRPQNLRSSKKE
jgi:hypothetical protein